MCAFSNLSDQIDHSDHNTATAETKQCQSSTSVLRDASKNIGVNFKAIYFTIKTEKGIEVYITFGSANVQIFQLLIEQIQ